MSIANYGLLLNKRVSFRAASVRKEDGFLAVLAHNAYKLKYTLELFLKFLEIKLVHMKRIRPCFFARLRIITLVRRRNQKNSARPEHTRGFFNQVLPIFQVLDDFECSNHIEECAR